jgi:hypothetical protein
LGSLGLWGLRGLGAGEFRDCGAYGVWEFRSLWPKQFRNLHV